MPQTSIEKANLESGGVATTPLRPIQFRGARMEHFPARPFPRLFEDQVRRAPETTAVICENERLSFRELNARANQIAGHLRALGVGPESLVGICVDRSIEMAVGILAILKSGGAYLPLDPEYPKDRLAFMLSDARPPVVLTKSTLVSQLPETESRIVLLDEDRAAIACHPERDLSGGPHAGDLAYVIYTSGSTGQPKGVMITHGNLANYLLALNHELQITPGDLYLHTASLAFSSSRRQLMLPLSQGAAVAIASSDERKDPLELFEMIRDRGVTVMDAVPSFWRICTSTLAGLETEKRRTLLENKLRLMLSASEPLFSDIPRTWNSDFGHPARHIHMFGQTETAGIVCLYRVPNGINGEISSLPIGKPIANTDIFILDEAGQPCPLGVAGELYIGGAGVGRGYLNRPDLTAEKFLPHPFSNQHGAMLYRTGDWARCRADGQLEFAGRRDQQVKLRGFRVEPGEVETALAKHPSIREGVVVARREDDGEQRLIAYFVSDGLTPGARPSISELRSFLSGYLPEHAIPSTFVQLNELPISANGKVNRLALPAPEAGRPELSNTYVAPRTSTEKRLVAIWCDVLRIAQPGINDNFFELGGHSLLATQVIARVRSELKTEIPLRLLFECPTVALLAGRLETTNPANGGLLPRSIQSIERNGTAPLSYTQQQFWLLDQSEPDSSYNVNSAVRIEGPLDVKSLRQALEALVNRHEILRTNLVVEEGGPTQVIAQSMPLALKISDLTSRAGSGRQAEIDRVLAVEAAKPFDLSKGPLLKTTLLKIGEHEHVLLITAHHIICDGWSVGVLLRELTGLYQSFAGNRPTSLPQMEIQYADFALWQRRRLQGEFLGQLLDYWQGQLAGAPAALTLPADYPRPAGQACKGGQLSKLLPAALSTSIAKLGQRENTTLFMTLLAGFQTLLYRYSGQEDIIVGSPVAGRTMLETETLIGAFVNTLVLRGDLSGNPTFRELLSRVRETALGAFSHQDLPFEKLVEELNPERSLSRPPLFQVMFAFQNSPTPNIAVEGLTLTPLKLESNESKFDLTLEVEEETDGLRITFEYNADLFEPATIQRMLGHFQNLLEAVAADPTQRVADLSLLSDSERHQQVVEWNRNHADFPAHACVHRLFEAQVEKTPGAIAAEFQGQQLTYQELNRRANQLAHFLRKNGIGPEVLVGICVERSLEMLIGVLGVLKSGGAYLPLDPAYPRDRLAFMIDDAALSMVLTQQHLAGEIPGGHAKIVCLDEQFDESEQNPAVDVTATNLAYVIYTSGSSGKPKGVMIEHRSLVNFTTAAAEAYAIDAGDRVLQFASLCFDLSAEEIYPALTRGATVVLRTDEMISSARDFLRHCDQWGLSVLDLPTAYWHELTDALNDESLKLPGSLRLVIIGGEKASVDRVAVWKKLIGESVRLVNSYGPTETTVVATMCNLEQHEWHGSAASSAEQRWSTSRARDHAQDARATEQRTGSNIPIGRAIANASVYVLDDSLEPVPLGAPGELHIGGAGVARGYLNRAELTSEKFISDPFSHDGQGRLYKTGDLVRYRQDGNIEFLGRIDNQIKIRGFRVELEEIEQALRSHPGVAECVVVLGEDGDGDKRLLAYLVPELSAQPSLSELRNFLKAKLPSYMLPAAFEMIEALPLMPNGKIDRRALPGPQSTRAAVDDGFIAPRTPIEQLLAEVWCEVLKLERIGVHDNFFELGGHSLLAAKVVSGIRRELDVNLGMVDVFQAPTIATLAELLYPRGAQNGSESELAALLEELAGLTDAEAQERFDCEMRVGDAAAA